MPPDAGGREIGAPAAARHITVRACLPPRVEKEGKMRSAQIEIEGIGAARAVEKLVQGGVPVLGAKLQKKRRPHPGGRQTLQKSFCNFTRFVL